MRHTGLVRAAGDSRMLIAVFFFSKMLFEALPEKKWQNEGIPNTDGVK